DAHHVRVVQHIRCGYFQPSPVPVGVHRAILERSELSWMLRDVGENFGHAGCFVGMYGGERVGPYAVIGLVTQDAFDGWTFVEDVPVASVTMITSEAFCTSERKRASLRPSSSARLVVRRSKCVFSVSDVIWRASTTAVRPTAAIVRPPIAVSNSPRSRISSRPKLMITA